MKTCDSNGMCDFLQDRLVDRGQKGFVPVHTVSIDDDAPKAENERLAKENQAIREAYCVPQTTRLRDELSALRARLEAAEGIVVGLAGLGGPVSDKCTPESIWTMIERARAHVEAQAKREGKS